MRTELLVSCMLAACGTLAPIAGSQTLQPTSATAASESSDGRSRTWTERPIGDPIIVTGTTERVSEPAKGYSAERRRAQAERLALREQLDWGKLTDGQKAALWETAVWTDQVDDRGINLVSFAWSYTKSVRAEDHVANDLVLNVDGDVVIVGSDLGGNNADPGYSRIFATELYGAANASQGWTENWERAPWYGGSDGWVSGERGAVDLRGNTYTCGFRSDGRFTVWKFDGTDGSTIWSRNGTIDGGDNAIATDIAVDPEGVVYVSGSYEHTIGNAPGWFVARLNPDTGDIDWMAYPPLLGEPTGGIEFDRRGDLFIGGYSGTNHLVAKMNPYDGSLIWAKIVGANNSDNTFNDGLKLDADGNAFFAGRINGVDNGWRTTKFDGDTGDVLWTQDTASGDPKDLEVDSLGNAYVCGNDASSTFKLVKYTPDGTEAWTATTGTTGTARCITLDRLDNPYITGWYGSGEQSIQTMKFDPANGDTVWVMTDTPSRPNETNLQMRPQDIIVDAGGCVYVAGWRRGVDENNGAVGQEYFCVKYEQPYLSIPQITRNYPEVRMEGRSLWDPDGSLGIDGFEYSATLFELRVDDVTSANSIENALSSEIDYGAGVVEGGVEIGSSFNNSRVEVRFDAAVSAGTFDSGVTGKLAIAVPGEAELNATQDFDIVINWDPDELGMELLANAEPRMEAGIVGQTYGNLNVDLRIHDTFAGTIVDRGVENGSLAAGPVSLWGVDFVNLPPAGVWYEPVQFPYDRFFEGRLRSPLLETEGVYDPGSGTISSSLHQKFFNGTIKVTELISAYFGGPPLSFGWGAPGGANGYEAKIEGGLLQAKIDGELYVIQDLDLEIRPYVRLEFATAGDETPATAIIELVNNNGVPVQRTHTVRMPDNGELEITPTFGVNATLTNSSGLEIVIGAGFDTAKFEAALSAVDVDIVDKDICLGCIDDSISWEVRPTDWLNGGDGISEDFAFPNEHIMSPIQVFGDTNLQPQLIGASREAARMLIYNQRNPNQSDFTAMAGGTSPMVLYGYKFFGGTNIKVKLSHHGRTENLERTRLNNQALLIEVPNRFFLLPGTARLWVTNDNGISESIDLVIEYPYPNFEGIEEELWASDPRWVEQPITAIDGGTPAGNDSFITRRDYYSYLAANLWGPDILQDLNNTDQEAWEYFDEFKGWERPGDAASPPGFPSMIFQGVTLSREQGGANDGLFRVRVPEERIARSGFKSISICNPGPGGGMSRTRTVEVPAPRPVVWSVTPNLLRPGALEVDGDGRVRLSVVGPDTVPFFPGYESEKYGNFTPRSVVMIDGQGFPTQYIGSGELAVRVPAGALQSFGRRTVKVFTPNPNGMSYDETLTDGNGQVVFDEPIPGGGYSEPVNIEVLWPQPVVEFVSHREIELGSPPIVPDLVDGVPPADNHNITLLGENFHPNCIVFLNGSAIPTTRETPSLIRATISASDVATLGTIDITVGNPPPNVRLSDPFEIEVIPPAP